MADGPLPARTVHRVSQGTGEGQKSQKAAAAAAAAGTFANGESSVKDREDNGTGTKMAERIHTDDDGVGFH
jgi:hypothetical protein